MAGPFVFSGYHNKPQDTKEAFADLHGKRYFKTGDLGRFVKGGLGVPLLKITGRVKELYKLENGQSLESLPTHPPTHPPSVRKSPTHLPSFIQ